MGGEAKRPARPRGAGAEAAAPGRDPEQAPLRGRQLYKAVGLLFLVAVLLRFFDPLAQVLLITFVGIIFAIALHRIVSRIPLPRPLATVLVFLAALLLVVLGVWQGARLVLPELRALAGDLPQIRERIEGWQSQLEEQTGLEVDVVGAPIEALLENPLAMALTIATQALNVFQIIGLIVIVVVGAVFVAAKPNEQLLNPMLRTIPARYQDAFRRMLVRCADRLVAWLRGTAISMVLVGMLSGIVFWILGAPYPLLLGVVLGLLEVIPIVGPWLGGAIAVIATLVRDPGTALWVGLAVLVIQQIESNVVRPWVMSGAAELHPFVTLVALLLFGSLFGFLGALLALPLVLVIGTVVEVFWVEETLDAGEAEIEPLVQE